MASVASSKDLLMLLLYAKGHKGEQCEPVRGRTRVMKMVFLFDKELRREFNLEKVIPDSAIPNFQAYNFGPFAADIFSDLEFLVELGFVQVSLVEGEDPPSDEEQKEYEYWQAGKGGGGESDLEAEERFELTPLGQSFVESELLNNFSKEQLAVLDKFKARCTAATLDSLLSYVYTRYPEMAKKSKVRKRYLPG